MSTPYLGEIRLFGGNFAPRGFAFCDGQLLPISGNDALFTLLGTTYGGDGQTTFALPDMRGRVPVHQGLGGFVMGQMAGTENETLSVQQIAAHTHDLRAASGGTPQSSPAGALVASGGPQQFASDRTSPATGSLQTGLASFGSSQPHSNVMPYQVVNFIIALEGVFPSQN